MIRAAPGRTVPVVDDAVVTEVVTARMAVGWMAEAVRAHHRGRLLSPARVSAELDDDRLVFTTGRAPGSWFGYRSYDTFGHTSGEQLVVCHSDRTGEVEGICLGNALGQVRTGGLGGVAVDLLARPDARTLGVIGTGAQAWRQVWAISAVRELEHLSVHSRTPDSADAFARRASEVLGVRAQAVPTCEEAVSDRDVVVLATSSPRPVLRAAWLSPGTHVSSVGPKQRGRSEIGADLVEAASVISTDSLAQLDGYSPPALAVSAGRGDDVLTLGAVAEVGHRARTGDLTLYLSVGLAGSEVHLLHRLLTRSAPP